MAAKTRAWQRMLSGRRLDLLDPTPVDIEIEDIAHGLAFVARWNGQTLGDYAYSVAEHSLLTETIFGRIAPKAPAKCFGFRRATLKICRAPTKERSTSARTSLAEKHI